MLFYVIEIVILFAIDRMILIGAFDIFCFIKCFNFVFFKCEKTKKNCFVILFFFAISNACPFRLIHNSRNSNTILIEKYVLFEFQSAGIGEPSVYHALVVIFLEFFAWGLLTMPVITVS